MITNIDQALKYIYSFINKNSKSPGINSINRTKYFLELLNNPQDKIKIIHIAGTSGKGSTSYIINHLLHDQGFTTGLHLSPHLIDIRERFMINSNLISEEKFVNYLNEIIPYINDINFSEFGKLTYFELLVGLAYYIFYKENVDYAIVETGLGGLYDATNTINSKNKLCVITRIGLDHTKVLGNTKSEITKQKAGIIQNENNVLTIRQENEIEEVLQTACAKKNATLNFIEIKNIKSGLTGNYQKENISLALATVSTLSKRDSFIIKPQNIITSLMNAHFKGRFDIIKKDNYTLIMDGAHNPQKMQAFTDSLKLKFPNKKFHFIFASKKKKEWNKMLEFIIPVASHITLTSFFVNNQDLVHLSEDPKIISKYLDEKDFKNYSIDNFKNIINKTNEDLVITGSLYLLSEVYKLFDKII